MRTLSFCWWVLIGVVPAASGCYTYAPLDTSAGVQAGEHVAVEVTDRGRAELGERLGPGIRRIEGTLSRVDSQELVLNVWRVASIDGAPTRWSGESVRFSRDLASRVETRTLNRPRTYLVVGASVVGVLLFAKSYDLFGSYNGGQDSIPEQPPSSSRGWWY